MLSEALTTVAVVTGGKEKQLLEPAMEYMGLRVILCDDCSEGLTSFRRGIAPATAAITVVTDGT